MSISLSQDTIFFHNDDFVVSKVIEVLPEQIKYKKFDYPDGPVYIKNQNEIARIVYANGYQESFSSGINKLKNVKRKRKYPAHMMIQLGSSMATLSGDIQNNKYKANFAGGLGFEIPIDTIRLNFIDISLLYEVKGTKFEDNSIEYWDEDYEVIDAFQSNEYITLLFAYKRYLTKNKKIYAKLGVFGGYLASATIYGNLYDLASGQKQNFDDNEKGKYLDLDIGGSIGAGISLPLGRVEYLSYFISEVRYNHSFYNIYDDETDSYKEFNSSFLLIVGIKFML
jgi:hypothetical protein